MDGNRRNECKHVICCDNSTVQHLNQYKKYCIVIPLSYVLLKGKLPVHISNSADNSQHWTAEINSNSGSLNNIPVHSSLKPIMYRDWQLQDLSVQSLFPPMWPRATAEWATSSHPARVNA
jgi:hypothetical protein